MRVTKVIALAIVGAFLVSLAAGAPATRIKKTELPDAVLKTVDRHAPGGRVVRCWRIEGDHEAMYEVDLKVDGRKKGFIVSLDGKLLTIQEEVAWHELPGVVQDRFERVARGNEIEEVFSIAQHGQLVGYGARIDGEGIGIRDYKFQVGPNGEDFGGDAQNRWRDAWRESQPGPEQEPAPEPQPAPEQQPTPEEQPAPEQQPPPPEPTPEP